MSEIPVAFRWPTLFLLPALIMLTACSLINQEADSATATAFAGATSLPTITETATGPILLGTPIPAPTEAATPTGESPRPTRLLPGPFYFINTEDQITRVEADLLTQSVITAEGETIIYLAVNPVDGRLAYVAGNSLVESDAFGGERTLKVARPQPADDDFAAQINGTISHPVYSPDGTQLAFGLGGVMVMPVGPDNVFTPIIASDPYPEEGDFPTDPVLFYRPEAWSPDGTRMLATFSYYPEAGGIAIVDVDDGEVTFVTSPEGIACCNPTWSADGTAVYFASQFAGLLQPGFWRADAATGTGVALVPGVPSNGAGVANLVSHPAELAAGRVFAFHQAMPVADLPGIPRLTLSQFDGRSFVPLRGDWQPIDDVLWSPDGRGALVVLGDDDGAFGFPGPLVWAPADGGPLLPLDLTGSHPRWATTAPAGTVLPGPTRPVTATETLIPPATATIAPDIPTPTPACFNAASFIYDVTIPDGTAVNPGEVFVKTWQLRNDGTCTWENGYVLAFARGEQLGGPPTVALTTAVAPGATLDISVPLVGPDDLGAKQGWWQLEAPDGTRFGPQVFVLVNVVSP